MSTGISGTVHDPVLLDRLLHLAKNYGIVFDANNFTKLAISIIEAENHKATSDNISNTLHDVLHASVGTFGKPAEHTKPTDYVTKHPFNERVFTDVGKKLTDDDLHPTVEEMEYLRTVLGKAMKGYGLR